MWEFNIAVLNKKARFLTYIFIWNRNNSKKS